MNFEFMDTPDSIEQFECIGGFADGKMCDGFHDGEMIMIHIKDGKQMRHRYIEHEGAWFYWPLFNRLVAMNYYDWTINND